MVLPFPYIDKRALTWGGEFEVIFFQFEGKVASRKGQSDNDMLIAIIYKCYFLLLVFCGLWQSFGAQPQARIQIDFSILTAPGYHVGIIAQNHLHCFALLFNNVISYFSICLFNLFLIFIFLKHYLETYYWRNFNLQNLKFIYT